MRTFCHLKSYKRLLELAEECVDLSDEAVMTPKRLKTLSASALGLRLLFGTEQVNELTLNALFELAQETQAVEKMHAMQQGEIVNKIEGCESERRAALHTAMRDLFENRQTGEVASEASKKAWAELEKLKAFLSEIDAKQIVTDMVQVGIGGSELGPKAVYYGLEAFKKPLRRLHFYSNIDPDEGAALFKQLDLARTLFVIVSKSGATLETKTNEEVIRSRLIYAGLDPKNHIIAVTAQKSPMDDPQRYLATFYMWDEIGGRYSVTSMVGAVTLAFALGMDRFVEFLRGASAMDKIALLEDPKENLPLLSALLSIWNRNFLGHDAVAVIPYSAALHRFPAHLQQLEMESNGKGVDIQGKRVHFETGPIFFGEPGTNGQHSFFQLLHQGTTVVPLHFIGFLESQYQEDLLFEKTTSQEKLLANMLAQSLALATGQKSDNPNKVFLGNRPSRTLIAERLTPYTFGAILSYFEHHTAFQGFIWNINSFDQEGVQLGKVLATRLMEQFANIRESKESEDKAFPLGSALLKQIRS